MTGKREYDALRDINRSRAQLDATRFDASERMTALVVSLLLQLFFARHCCNSVCLFPLRQHKEHTRAATTQLELDQLVPEKSCRAGLMRHRQIATGTQKLSAKHAILLRI